MAKWCSGELRFEGGKKTERESEKEIKRKKEIWVREKCIEGVSVICKNICVCVCVCHEKEKRCQREDHRKSE